MRKFNRAEHFLKGRLAPDANDRNPYRSLLHIVNSPNYSNEEIYSAVEHYYPEYLPMLKVILLLK
jgi:hypothetical protein